jgi:4-amino-4-deoxy-L-arabinose transferase-like glycosyltransferase
MMRAVSLEAVRHADTGRTLRPFAARQVAVVGAALAALLTALSGRYGYHRDELYFRVAGDHLAAGYVDQPPLTPLLARLSTTLFGETVMGLRVVSTLTCVAGVVVVALIARELGGGRRAQVFAAACAASSSVILVNGHMVSTASFDIFLWLLISLFTLRLLRTGDGRWYLAVGAAAGIGVLNKYLVALLLFGVLVSVLVVGPRRVLRSWWAAAGVLVALALAAPNLWWQAAHGWPQLTIAVGISAEDGAENRALFVPLQFVYLSPVFVPVLVAGMRRLWRDPDIRWARPFGLAYPLLAVLMLAIGGKAYYVIPLLVVVLAAGAAPAVRWAAARSRAGSRRWALPALVLGAAAVNVVVSLPVLPPTSLNPINGMNKEQGEQVGWPELTATVANAWREIPADRRDRAVIVTQNYGEAGAIARYGPEHGLPGPYSGHMSFADWGAPPDSATGPVVLVHYPSNRTIGRHFTDCRPVATVDNGHGLENDEQGAVVRLCAGTDAPWSTIWPDLRRYY